jgi:hypothetical protein
MAQKMTDEHAVQTGAEEQYVHNLWINPFADAAQSLFGPNVVFHCRHGNVGAFVPPLQFLLMGTQ